jgi:hypothetical protein
VTGFHRRGGRGSQGASTRGVYGANSFRRGLGTRVQRWVQTCGRGRAPVSGISFRSNFFSRLCFVVVVALFFKPDFGQCGQSGWGACNLGWCESLVTQPTHEWSLD